MLHPAVTVVLVLGVLAGMITLLSVWQRRAAPHPELVRKALHVGMGLLAATFPWLFASAAPVAVLCACAAATMVAAKSFSRLAAVVGAVDRASRGDIYFPLAVGVTFVSARGDKLLYAVPILVLALADATAALVGLRYGTHRYRATQGLKSAEGSVAFFVTAFVAVFVPVWAVAHVPLDKALLMSSTLGLLVMALEAVAWRGLDNLFIPLGTFVLLKIFLMRTVPELWLRLGLALALFAFMLWWRRRTTLNDSAVLGAAFAAYVFGAVGGWRWLVAPLTVLVSYTTLLSPRTRRDIARPHTVYSVISVASGGLAWLFVATATGRPELLYGCSLAFACHLGIIGAARLRFAFPRMPAPVLLATCTVKSWVLIFAPYALVESPAWWEAGVAVAPVAMAVVAFYLTQPGMDDCPVDTARWIRQGLVVGASSALGQMGVALT